MNTEKSPDLSDFSLKRVTGLAVVLCVVRSTAYSPEVRTHGLFATGGVLLREEILLVLRDLGQIVRALLNGCLHSGEASADSKLFVGQRSRTSDRTQAAEEETITTFRCSRCYTVGSKNHLLVCCVRRLLVDFNKRSADGFDGVSPFYFCHSLLAITRVIRCSAAQ